VGEQFFCGLSLIWWSDAIYFPFLLLPLPG